MRVVFDHQCFSIQVYGGISRYFCELALHLQENEQVNVAVSAPLYINNYLSNTASIRPCGLKIPHVAYTGLLVRFLNSMISNLALKHRTDVDIFHETYYMKLDNSPRSAMRVLTVFDMIHEKFPGAFSSKDKTSRLKALAVNRADHVICISENTRRDLVELFGVEPQKTSVVYLGHSLQVGGSASQLAQTHRQPFVLYVGKRGGYKNFSALVRALGGSRLPAAGFHMVCFGGGPLSTAEIEHMRACQLDPELITYCSGTDDILAGLYQRAALLVYPSLYEGFGIPPLEAMALGCPVVCTNTSSLPEVVGDAAELFDPSCSEQITAALEAVALSPERASILSRLGRERAQLFSWKKCAEDTLHVYQRLSEG